MFTAKQMSLSPSTHKDYVKDEAMCLRVPSVEKYI